MNDDCRLRQLPIVVFVLLVAPSAWSIDVKPGLWEISSEGVAEPQRVCYTEQFLASSVSDLALPPGLECRNEVRESSGTRVVTHTVCTGTMSMEGDTSLTAQSPESMTMESTSVMNFGGRPQTITASARYRWLDSDCGDVKPFDPNTLFE